MPEAQKQQRPTRLQLNKLNTLRAVPVTAPQPFIEPRPEGP
jgi:hypothetical protein